MFGIKEYKLFVKVGHVVDVFVVADGVVHV